MKIRKKSHIKGASGPHIRFINSLLIIKIKEGWTCTKYVKQIKEDQDPVDIRYLVTRTKKEWKKRIKKMLYHPMND